MATFSCPKIYIYILTDPISKEVRYVGKTVQEPNQRLYCHISRSRHNKKKDYCHCWIKGLLNDGLLPIIEVIEETFDISRETYWINFYRKSHPNLTNFTDGGELGSIGKKWKISKEALQRRRDKLISCKTVYRWNINGVLIDTFPSIVAVSEFFKLKTTRSIDKCMKEKRSYGNLYFFTFDSVFLDNLRKLNKVTKPIYEQL